MSAPEFVCVEGARPDVAFVVSKEVVAQAVGEALQAAVKAAVREAFAAMPQRPSE